jgi:hypothetical protein
LTNARIVITWQSLFPAPFLTLCSLKLTPTTFQNSVPTSEKTWTRQGMLVKCNTSIAFTVISFIS